MIASMPSSPLSHISRDRLCIAACSGIRQHNKALSGHFSASNALGTRASIFGARLAEHTTASKISEHC
jgi:hypothetical protein